MLKSILKLEAKKATKIFIYFTGDLKGLSAVFKLKKFIIKKLGMYLYFYLMSGNFLLQKTKTLNQLFFIDQEKHSTLKVQYKFSNFNFHVFFIYLRAILKIC